ncbi:hypothetical protein CAPTEDRAFT_195559 [Capitella teleta]|uniref:F5/8 type C domain-containing protein n=1 Tax=Capitella teleta TaxID=283909 RepID=R7UB39_CAPTE|nr:hypothetical protein CAPTEDRAFT_195559 [Capitella teleta]|eukprot:ELU01008.1 hypothetical protein CAPTEDRAFT_195559 [Capitella teleta]
MARLLLGLLLLASLSTVLASIVDSCASDLSAMIDGAGGVDDSKLNASSIYSESYSPAHSRLTATSSWLRVYSDSEPWLQVEFEASMPIIAIDTKGYSSYYVTEYKISHSMDGLTWIWYENDASPRVFSGSLNDSSVLIRNYFDPPIEASFLRLHPVAWNEHPGVKWELYTCDTYTTESETTSANDMHTTDPETTSANDMHTTEPENISANDMHTTKPETTSANDMHTTEPDTTSTCRIA